MKNRKTSLVILLAVVLILVGAAIWLLGGDAESNRPKTRDGLSQEAHDLLNSSAAEFEQRVKNGFDVPAEKLLEDYRKLLRYPPNSRLLRASDVDLIRFHQIKMPEDPVLVEKDGKLVPTEHTCVLQSKRYVVFEGAQLEARLICNGTERTGHVRVEVKGVTLERLYDDAAGKTVMVRLPTPDIKPAADNSVSFLYKPVKGDWGNLLLKVDFAIPGATSKAPVQRSAVFFASPETPARFTGILDEAVVNGSLVVSVGINVFKPGRYEIEANLFGPEGQAVTYAREQVRLAGGSQVVKLTFFGKIFHDKAVGGPYTIKGLRGHQDTGLDPDVLLLPPDEVRKRLAALDGPSKPDKRIIVPYEKDYKTIAYKIGDFSDKEFESPEKTARLRALEKLVAAGR